MEKSNDIQTNRVIENPKYKHFIKWLKDNGVIYENSLNLPVAFGTFGLVDVSAKESIEKYQSKLYIPKKIIIDSNQIMNKSYLSAFFKHKEIVFKDETFLLALQFN